MLIPSLLALRKVDKAMPQVTEGNIISYNLDGRMNGQQILLTTHWRVYGISPGGSVDADALWAAWKTFSDGVGELADVYCDALSDEVTAINNVFQLIYPDRYVRVVNATAKAEGQYAPPALPQNVALVVTMRGDLANPHSRGNKHIGGLPASSVENGMISATGNTDMGLIRNALRVSIAVVVGADTVTLEPIIYNRTAPLDSVAVTNGIVQQTSRVERRRTVGLGT